MGNSYLCYCKKNPIKEENNFIKVEGIQSTQQTTKKESNIKKPHKKKYGRAASYIKGHKNQSFITDEYKSNLKSQDEIKEKFYSLENKSIKINKNNNEFKNIE